MRGFFVLVLLGLALEATGSEVFRCSTADGTVFSDEPCGPDAEKITVEDNTLGGNFGANLPEPRQQTPATAAPEDNARQEKESACRYISSTRLRTLTVRGEVAPGMTTEQVRKAVGRPTETYPVPQQTWVYETNYQGVLYSLTYLYFRDGCVEKVVSRKP
jgi:hypothetical protein